MKFFMSLPCQTGRQRRSQSVRLTSIIKLVQMHEPNLTYTGTSGQGHEAINFGVQEVLRSQMSSQCLVDASCSAFLGRAAFQVSNKFNIRQT